MVSLQKLAAEAVQPAYDELVHQLPQQAVLSIDEWASASTWMSSECKHSDVSVARLAWQETLS